MRWHLFFGMFLVAAFLGTGNNLVNPNRVSWLGSAEVLPKPEGWPSLTVAQGVAAGVKVAKHEVTQHWALAALALLLLATLIRASHRFRHPVSGGIISWLR